MEKFKYKFATKIYILLALGFILTAVCLVMNVIRIGKIIATDTSNTYAIISVAIAILMCVAFSVIMISLLIDSSYVFEPKFLVLKFGIIKTNTDYTKIKQIVWFKQTNKLTIYHDDETFSTIVISDNEYELFANTLIAHNKNIRFHVDIDH